MEQSEDDKRREALKRMRDLRGTSEGKPQQLLAQPNPPAQGPQGAGGPGAGGGQGAKLREFLAKRAAGGAAGGAGAAAAGLGAGQGGKLRDLLANRTGGVAVGGAAAGGLAGGQGAKLRELLAKRAAGGAAGGIGAGLGGGQGGKLRDLLANRAGGATGGAASGATGGAAGNRPFLQKLMAQRAAGAKPADEAAYPGPDLVGSDLGGPDLGGSAMSDPDLTADPEAVRARLRDRISKLQARLDEIDRAAVTADDGIEDATVTSETPGPGAAAT